MIQPTIGVKKEKRARNIKIINKQKKTVNSNSIADLKALNNLLQSKVRCKYCVGENVEVKIKEQVGIAFAINLECTCVNSNQYTILLDRSSEDCEHPFLAHLTNLHSIIATFYTGSTINNSRYLYSLLSLPNMNNWSNQHYRKCKVI